MNIHDIYAWISMPAPPSGRVPQAFICDAIYVVFSEHRWGPKGGCLITDFRTTGRGKFKFDGQVGETDYSTALPGSDPNPNYLGDVSNHRL
jgi:hypothetical protein